MVSSRALELGRSAVAGRRWREACEQFAEAQSTLAEGLAPLDLELMATALFLRGRHESAFEALMDAHERYLAGGDTVGAARTAGWIALELLEADELSPSLNWIARGQHLMERLDDADSVGGRVALVPAALAPLFVGDVEDAKQRFEAIATVAERTGDRELSAFAALGRGKCLTTMGRPAEGFESLDRAVAAVTANEVSPVMTCILYRVLLDVSHEAFDLERAQVWTAAFDQWCREQPDLVAYSGQCHAYRAQQLLLHGEWAEASAAATTAEERFRAGDFTAAYVANYQLAELHRLRGELRRAGEHYRRAAETGWDPQPGIALLRLAEGEYTTAQSMIRSAVAGAEPATRRRLLPAVVEIELVAGDVTAARRAAAELIALSRSAPTTMLAAIAGFAEARVLLAEGDPSVALERVRTASTAWSALDVPYEVARCGVVRGQALRALDKSDAATAEFEAARAVFLELGAQSELTGLTTLTGQRPTGTLTDREVEVLRLVSTGLTNRGIAGRLSLSEKTVARHLSNIFGKLGLSSRAAATAYAYENGLI
ncbi:helix-turn-helix transcriptional regulator [Cryobacterium sp. N22]|uniref:helix-turn-helix transcriptional regulator n=1 Tax=Cryobacterium sp. N22 TaxID=2048290 RepID=UPI0013048D81|nr:helix-turn-helix transcriptional regulator [Cryobacterium sp. N22]